MSHFTLTDEFDEAAILRQREEELEINLLEQSPFLEDESDYMHGGFTSRRTPFGPQIAQQTDWRDTPMISLAEIVQAFRNIAKAEFGQR